MFEIEITIYDAAGNVAEHYKGPAPTASDAEIDDMIALIDNGCPAHIAAMLAKQSPAE